jgi:hypothetical protein
MKAITLTQPWATLVAIGAKRIETRSWSTRYIGDLLIHAAKSFPAAARELCSSWPFNIALARVGIDRPAQLPLGAIVGLTQLESCVPTPDVRDWIGAEEKEFGDYGDGRYAWVLAPMAGLRRFRDPIPCRGMLGIWTAPNDLPEGIPFKSTITR